MAKKKYGELETLRINDADYDMIYSVGYEDCMLDCKINLTSLVEQIEEDGSDALEVLKGFIESMNDALGNVENKQ